LAESYRNINDRICHRTLLNVGFMADVSVEHLNSIRAHLNNLYNQQSALFEETDPLVKQYAESFWQRLIREQKIDIDKAQRQVVIATIQHSNVREIGAEWICCNTWNKLEITDFL
jgi:UDP-N-acetyl-D-mannosaminuronate dehydrogenase